ncbi:probable receptor-like protein kinase at5g20050 [Phtheirospermum japonicum]|uniref:Probable receptor-like protein kinase at5g20050 n=1 Tax=Phtheirospermum japonicum TaxID=374723 RepID=A0A830B4K0_9LAMI|nr:probable receptor-like protein kinase at5g20050 [Phtheirospermum japonicum]
MEDRRANLIALSIIVLVIVLLIVARISLNLSKTFFLICGFGVAAILAVLTFIIIRSRFNSRRKQLERDLDSQGRELRIEYSFLRKVAGVPTKFRHRELEEATDGFRSVIGRGASGSVFKGILSDGTAVAVKRIEGEERGDKAFKSEVAAIASVQHVNLVRLLGYCIASTGGPRLLVYDFIHNGADPRRRSGCLSWDNRCRVAYDVARALSYLHHDCRSCVLHLDVKPENILIDENYRALVSDFGLSKLKGRDESRVVTTIRGTRGYLAPEWLLENGVSEKCDVYSYGMVLLEIIGGRKSISVVEQGHKTSKKKFEFFPRIVAEKMRDGKLMEIVDERLVGGTGIEERELKKMVVVALWCIQEKAKLRPSMAQVVEMLEGRAPIQDPPNTQFLIVDLLSIDDHQNDNGKRPAAAAASKPRFVQMDGDTSTSAYSFSFSSLTGR